MRKMILPLLAVAALAACDRLPTSGDTFAGERTGDVMSASGMVQRSASRTLQVAQQFDGLRADRITLDAPNRATFYGLDTALTASQAVCVTARVRPVFRGGDLTPAAYRVERIDVRKDVSRMPTPLACE